MSAKMYKIEKVRKIVRIYFYICFIFFLFFDERTSVAPFVWMSKQNFEQRKSPKIFLIFSISNKKKLGKTKFYILLSERGNQFDVFRVRCMQQPLRRDLIFFILWETWKIDKSFEHNINSIPRVTRQFLK